MERQIKHHTLGSLKKEPDKRSRRQFLAQSGKVVAGSVLTGIALPRIYAAQDNTIRLALVGCGGRGTGAVADAFSTTGGQVRLYAMADLFEGRLQSSLKNLKKGFGDKVDVPPERQFLGFDGYKKA
ncbi:MAG: gfo/Idh/MocA family oxidoreductase, partial [Planctomycetota bacterium]